MSFMMLLSPAKKQQIAPVSGVRTTKPRCTEQMLLLAKTMKSLSASEMMKYLGISDKLAALNVERFHDFSSSRFCDPYATPSLSTYQGDAYKSLDAGSLSPSAWQYLQKHLRIISGFYGLLRPCDLMQPYRLEMATKLAGDYGKDLYALWQPVLAGLLKQDCQRQKITTVVNVASKDYSQAIDGSRLGLPVVDVVFKNQRSGDYKIIGLLAKRARGAMVRFAAEHSLQQVEDLQAFNVGGYRFQKRLSTEAVYVFHSSE